MTLGIVDHARSPIIRGWVTHRQGEKRRIQVLKGDEICVECVADRVRRDLTGKLEASGFEATVPGGFDLADLATARLSVVVIIQDRMVPLPLWKSLDLASRLAGLKGTEFDDAFALLSNTAKVSLRKCVLRELSIPNSNAGDFSFQLGDGSHFGDISDDFVAMRGAAEHYFLYAGSNNVIQLYRSESVNRPLVEAWHSIIETRRLTMLERGLKFVQVMIPEKSSQMPYLVPFRPNGATTLWHAIVEPLSNAEHVIDLLSDAPNLSRDAVFRRQDSHYSSAGCLIAAQTIVERLLGRDVRLVPLQVTLDRRVGDLAGRFSVFGTNPRLLEMVEIVQTVLVGDMTPRLVNLIHSYQPEGRNTESIRVWRCNDAPFDHRVVCFGNSFFERGNSSTSLSWWFARLFKEFHFVWNSDLDLSYVDQVKPDFVICQTIERFLGRCPTS